MNKKLPLFSKDQLKIEANIIKSIKKLEKIESPTEAEKQLIKDKEQELKDIQNAYKIEKKAEDAIIKAAREDEV